MIQEEALKKAKILEFWQKYGLNATIEAFNVKRSTLYLWKKKLKESGGKLESLNNKSRAPKNKRKRIVDPIVEEYIIKLRTKYPRLGKEKISKILKEEKISNLSPSTIGRIINDLKERGKLPKHTKLSLNAKTGKLIEKKPRKIKKKLRRKGYYPTSEGDLIQIDTIVKFINGIKRYIITAIDLKSEFTFAYAYSSLNSKNTLDFFQKLQEVAPFSIKRIQTDNGSEFEKHFRNYIKKQNIIHYFSYPKHPQSNAHIERFNRTLQEEFIDYHKHTLAYNINQFNKELMEYLIWYNTKRPHYALNLISPMEYIISNLSSKESNMWWTYTVSLLNVSLIRPSVESKKVIKCPPLSRSRSHRSAMGSFWSLHYKT
jgi:transposase InsO family protein